METISKSIYTLLGGDSFAKIAKAKFFAYGDDYILFRLFPAGNGPNLVKIKKLPEGKLLLEFHFCDENGCRLKSKFESPESPHALRQFFTLGTGIYFNLN